MSALNYTLVGKIGALNAVEQAIVKAHPPVDKGQWTEDRYQPIKARVKDELTLGQFDRCAYCRSILEGDAKYEPLDHIIIKSEKPQWMFEPLNLVLTCTSCNNLKNIVQTLVPAYVSSAVLPAGSAAYRIFNPHYDNWDDHLQFENDIFLVPVPGSKGQDTIIACKLYRYNIVINRARELKMAQKEPLKRTFEQLRNLKANSQIAKDIEDNLMELVDFYLKRVLDNPAYM